MDGGHGWAPSSAGVTPGRAPRRRRRRPSGFGGRATARRGGPCDSTDSCGEATRPGHAGCRSPFPRYITSPDGFKTRFLDTITREIRAFQDAVQASGGVAGGLHLETVADDVTECVPNETYVDQVGDRYTSFCDPRLNPSQAVSVVSAWRG